MAPALNFNSISNTVCVMDASTRLGSSLVKRLLTNGYTVHAAIQNIHNGGHGEFLDACDMKRIKNFHLDPFDYHSIVDALKGCSGLFYSFEPPKDQSCTYDEILVAQVVDDLNFHRISDVRFPIEIKYYETEEVLDLCKKILQTICEK